MKVSVFTPTYNRAHLLGTLYESLLRQTCFDFEWIIVDDGSSDNTSQVVDSFIKECHSFPIEYIKKNNGGKHTAINVAVNHARGQYFIIVDSDDYLVPNAVKYIIRDFEGLEKESFAGVGYLRAFENGKIVGQSFNGNYIDATTLERNKYQIIGDKAEAFFTDVLRNFPFPEFENERFLSEAVVWNRIASAGFKIRWFNVPIYICRYQIDGLSMDSGIAKSPRGYTLYIKELLKCNTDLASKIKNLGVYSYIMHKYGNSYSKLHYDVDCSAILLVFSCFLYSVKSKLSKNNRKKVLNISD